jgi:hypothetical protein
VTTTPQPDRIDGAAYLRLVGLGAAFAAVRFPAIFLGIGLAMLVELLDVSPLWRWALEPRPGSGVPRPIAA